MPRPRMYTKEEKIEKNKEWSRKTYLNSFNKSIKSSCQNCFKVFSHRAMEKNRKFCTVKCGTNNQWSIYKIKMQTKIKEPDESVVDLRKKWEMYHNGWITFSDVLENKVMHQKFTNNKSKESYEGFGYFSLVNI
jgi:hypothetical protein